MTLKQLTLLRTRQNGALLLVALAGCTALSDGNGKVSFTTYGEDYIEREIPATDVEDGWRITFDEFLISIGEVSIGEPNAAPAYRMQESMLVSMKSPGDKPVTQFSDVPARAYPNVRYAVLPVTETALLGVGATAEQKARMMRDGQSLYVSGRFTKGSDVKSFAWGFSARTSYENCKADVGGKETPGIVVTKGVTESVQLTIHGDHLFYDDLRDPNAKLRVDAIASADTDGNGDITLAELASVKLASIPSTFGPYGTGSASGIHDLRAFVEALSHTVGHFRGEGDCIPTR
jgi:hypothetical protein